MTRIHSGEKITENNTCNFSLDLVIIERLKEHHNSRAYIWEIPDYPTSAQEKVSLAVREFYD